MAQLAPLRRRADSGGPYAVVGVRLCHFRPPSRAKGCRVFTYSVIVYHGTTLHRKSCVGIPKKSFRGQQYFYENRGNKKKICLLLWEKLVIIKRLTGQINKIGRKAPEMIKNV